MAALTSLGGYPARLWRTLLAVLSYADTELDVSANASSQQTFVSAVQQTFRNGRDSLDAYIYATAWADEYTSLAPILTYNLSLSDSDLAYVTNRITAIQEAAQAVATLYPNTFSSTSLLVTGAPIVQNPKLVEFLMSFTYEQLPAVVADYDSFSVDWNGSFGSVGGLAAAFASAANAQATAWANCVIALQTGGVTLGNILDAAQRQAAISLEVANAANTISVSANTDPNIAWNQLICMPCLARVGAVYAADPTAEGNQQLNIARFVVCQTIDTFDVLLMRLRQYLPAQLRVATLLNSDTLVSFAARELGNFELWPTVAILNNLVPPYIGAINSPPVAGIALPGQKLFVPINTSSASATTPSQAITTQVPTYENNYLGVDIYLGPLGQNDMTQWTGDFNLISGYQNLQNAILRRLQTTIGNLMFHPNYGSRIPPEIGNIMTSATAGYIKAYAESAILTDPRVYEVTNVTATADTTVYAVGITATVTPNGGNVSSTQINEVLQPA